jgi:hypothetical protein
MARNRDPVSDDEIVALRDAMDAQRADIRTALADDLGGDPDDYDGGDRAVADGGDESDAISDRIGDHFDRVRAVLDDELEDSSSSDN